jgi:hypothetical protein
VLLVCSETGSTQGGIPGFQKERGEPVSHGLSVANSRPRSTLPIQQAESTY